MVEGYCMKCKAKSEMKDTQEVVMKNGRKALKGKCAKPSCGTSMFKIMAGPSTKVAKSTGSKKSKKSKKGKAGAGYKKSKKSTKTKSKKSKKSKKSMK
jgi:hypothetical protein